MVETHHTLWKLQKSR